MYFFIESSVALLISLFINVFVVAVFADGLYGKKNSDVVRIHFQSQISYSFRVKKIPFSLSLYIRFIFAMLSFFVLSMNHLKVKHPLILYICFDF